MTGSDRENQVSSYTLIKTHNTSDIRYDVSATFYKNIKNNELFYTF